MTHDYTMFLHSFNGVLNGLKLYPSQHPASQRLHETLWQALQLRLQHSPSIKIGLIDDTLFINDHLFADKNNPAAHSLVTLLNRQQIRGIEIFPELLPAQMQEFTELLSSGKLRGELFDHQLDQRGIAAIRYADAEEHSDGSPARQAYDSALKTITHVSQQIEAGEVPQTARVVNAVEKMARQMLKTPYAMLALSMIKDYDNYTFTHSVNVAVIALTLGRACQLEPDTLNVLGVGSLLHDLGKLKIHPDIIKKPGKLSPDEYRCIKSHPELGAEIARQMSDIDPQVINIIWGHHVHHDRKGYPANIPAGQVTPLVEMTTIADTYDAITSLRAYRRPSSPLQAIAIMNKLAGSQLHPGFMERFQDALGTFPVGSLVRLVSNEVGLIVNMDALDLEKSTVRIVRDRDGRTISEPYDVELAQSSQNIISEVDPLRHNIDISQLM